jgi:hypothetical protein
MSEKKQTLCRACGSPFVHIKGTNVFVCSNVNCDGKVKDKDGKVRQGNTYFLAGQDKEERPRYKKI